MTKLIIDWLGYIPPLGVDEETLGGQLYIYRMIHGLNQCHISRHLKIDACAIIDIERNIEVKQRYMDEVKALIAEHKKTTPRRVV